MMTTMTKSFVLAARVVTLSVCVCVWRWRRGGVSLSPSAAFFGVTGVTVGNR